MSIHISPLASVDPRAELDDDVEIGPFCCVGPHVSLGSGTRLESHVVIVGHTTIGRNNRFWPNCVIGEEPQDYSYSDAPTLLQIGDDNIFREGVTVHRAAEKEDHITQIGNRNMFMANAHVAHNSKIADGVILVNSVQLGGHVHIHDGAIVSGGSLVHHFTTIGSLAFIGGGARVTADVPPYMLVAGSDHCRVVSLNLVGLQRRNLAVETIAALKRAHRVLFREHAKLEAARAQLTAEFGPELPPELTNLLNSIQQTQAGKNGRAGEARRGIVMEKAVINKERRRAA